MDRPTRFSGIAHFRHDRSRTLAQVVPRAQTAAGARRRAALALPPALRDRQGRRRHQLLHRRGRAGRLPRPQRRGQDDHPESPLRAAPSHRGPGAGGGEHAAGSRPIVLAADHAGDGPEAAAPLGPAALRDVPAQPRHLRHPQEGVRGDAGRSDRPARARLPSRQADAPALARRADDMRAGGGAFAPAQGALSRRADHRPRRLYAGHRPRLRARIQPALRRDGALDLALHGGRGGALPARDGDRQRQAHLRRQPARVGPAGAARQADDRAADQAGGAAGSRVARRGRRASRCRGGGAGDAGRAAGRGGAGSLDVAAARSHGGGSAARGSDARSLRPGARGMRHALKAFPQLLRTGFAEAVAYRAEFLIWMFSTNMPLVMLALWAAVARSGPVGSYTQKGFAAYYLAALLVRLLTGSWVVWEMTMEIRQGTLALRLLRPIHPLLAYSAENLAAVPMRGIVAIPLIVIFLWNVRDQLGGDPILWTILAPALLGSWLLP